MSQTKREQRRKTQRDNPAPTRAGSPSTDGRQMCRERPLLTLTASCRRARVRVSRTYAAETADVSDDDGGRHKSLSARALCPVVRRHRRSRARAYDFSLSSFHPRNDYGGARLRIFLGYLPDDHRRGANKIGVNGLSSRLATY